MSKAASVAQLMPPVECSTSTSTVPSSTISLPSTSLSTPIDSEVSDNGISEQITYTLLESSSEKNGPEFPLESDGRKLVEVDIFHDIPPSEVLNTKKELSQKTSGPKRLFSPEKKIKKIVCSSNEEVILENDCSLTRASLLCLMVYYIKNLTYPVAFAPILAILQRIAFPHDTFGQNLMSQKVKDTLSAMKLH